MDHPLIKEYLKSVTLQLQLMQKELEKLKEDYSLSHLNQLKSGAHKIATSSALYGFDEASNYGHQLELAFIEKIKNYQAEPPEKGYGEIDVLLNNLKNAFSTTQGTNMNEPKKTIVIVDDDEDLLKLLTFEFHNLGFEIKTFTTGKEALNFLLEEDNLKEVSLLILDRVLPDMDGLDILRKFQKQHPKRVPILILSILATETDILAGLQSGAIDYISKPFSVYLLLQKALNLMGSKYTADGQD